MKKGVITCLALLGGSIALAGWAPAPLSAGPHTVTGQVIFDWNVIASQNMSGSTLSDIREFATLHVAIYDAVVSITQDHQPYQFAVSAPPGASAEAAAVAAAHMVLVAFHPSHVLQLDAHYASALAAILDGQPKIDGVAVGEQVAIAVLAARTNDGFTNLPPTIPDGTEPYEWRRTPPGFAPPLVPHFATVTPWVIEEAAQFLPKPPPALVSRRYARDFDEVKAVGALNSAARPQDRTDVALFHTLSHSVFWNDVARQLWVAEPLSLSRTARLFALLNTTFMDAYIGAWHAKWNVYFNWRPITAIRLADTDGNQRTTSDPAWDPLLPTPSHPTYPSGHAVGSGAASHVLQRFFGRRGHSLTLTSPETAPGVTLHYEDLRDVVDDVQDARVYLGIHFRFDMQAGIRQGTQTARYVFQSAFRPLGNDDCHSDDEEETN
jgi:hypothetical protein